MEKRLFRGVRTITVYEEVEVFADTFSEAKEMIEDDDEEVRVFSERDSGYEVVGLDEVKD